MGKLANGKLGLWILLGVGLVIWGWVDVRRRAKLIPDGVVHHRTDFSVYTCSAKAMRDGGDIYNTPSPRGWYCLYPPVFLLIVMPVVDLAFENQAFIWFLFSLLLVAGAWYECRRIANAILPELGEISQRTYTFLGIAAALSVAMPVLNCLQRGQVGVLLLYLLLLGFRLLLEYGAAWSAVLGGVIITLAPAVKIPTALPPVLVGLTLLVQWSCGKAEGARGRAIGFAIGGIAGVFLWLFLVPSLYTGWDMNAIYLKTWAEKVTFNSRVGEANNFDIYTARNQALENAIYRAANFTDHVFFDGPLDVLDDGITITPGPHAMDHPAFRGIALAWRGLLAILLLATVWRMRHEADRVSLAAIFGLGCAGSLAISPISWGHHFAVLLPASLSVPWWLWSRGYQRSALAFATALPMLTLAHYFFLPWAGRSGVLGIGMGVWLTLACVVFTLQGRSWTLISFDWLRGRQMATARG